jgi:hypothetical protein
LSKLAEALRKKYRDPRAVIRALGLDESILKDAIAEATRLAQDAKPRALARDDQDVIRRGDSPTLNDPAVAEGERLDRAKDEGQITGADIEKILRLLREAGFDDRVIQRLSYALSDDEVEVVDTLPQNGMEGMGGKFAEKRMASDRRMAFDARKLAAHITVDTFGSRAPEPIAKPVKRGSFADRVCSHITIGG